MMSADACSSVVVLCTVAVEVDADGFVVGRLERVDEKRLRRELELFDGAPC